jgi:hypothetical protein
MTTPQEQDYSRFRLDTTVVGSRDVVTNFWKLVTRVITLYKDMYHYNESVGLQFNQSILSFYFVLSSFKLDFLYTRWIHPFPVFLFFFAFP